MKIPPRQAINQLDAIDRQEPEKPMQRIDRRISQSLRMSPRSVTVVLVAVFVVAISIVAAGCGSSLDSAFVKQTGVHSTQLETVYTLYSKDVLSKVSNRDLKDINAALAASDLKKATPGDLRRAQAEITSRIKTLEKFSRRLKAENTKLKKTEMPAFATGLDANVNSKQFADAYKDSTTLVERYTTADLATVKVVFSSLEKYLDFLEQWEQYLTDNDTTDLVESGKASDTALAKVNKVRTRLKARASLSSKLNPLVDQMALAASNESQIADLIREMKKQYPDSFLSKHVVEKK